MIVETSVCCGVMTDDDFFIPYVSSHSSEDGCKLLYSVLSLPLLVDDGSVKVWRNFVPEPGVMSPSAQLVTAWQAFADMLTIAKGSGLVVDWDQTSSLMYTSGDVRTVRIWDTETELRVQVWLKYSGECRTPCRV